VLVGNTAVTTHERLQGVSPPRRINEPRRGGRGIKTDGEKKRRKERGREGG